MGLQVVNWNFLKHIFSGTLCIPVQDGRVVEEEIPTVTLDTTQDSQTFETDHDEERYVKGEVEAKERAEV